MVVLMNNLLDCDFVIVVNIYFSNCVRRSTDSIDLLHCYAKPHIQTLSGIFWLFKKSLDGFPNKDALQQDCNADIHLGSYCRISLSSSLNTILPILLILGKNFKQKKL